MALLLDVASHLPPDVEGLYGWRLRQSEKAHGSAWVAAFASAIALSRSGWREADLLALVPRLAKLFDLEARAKESGELKLAALRRSLRAHVVQRSALAQWDFSHALTRAAVLRRHAGSQALQARLHSEVADSLDWLPPSDPLRNTEMMWHLIGSGDGGVVAQYYGVLRAPLGRPNHPATTALAEHLLSASGRQQERSLDLMTSPLQTEGLEHDLLQALCNRFQFDLNDSLENKAPLWVRLRLLECVQAALDRLCGADPSNAGWQRDLWVSHGKMAYMLERSREKGAIDWWRRALAVLSAMNAKGLLAQTMKKRWTSCA